MLISLLKHATRGRLQWVFPFAALMVGCTDQPTTPFNTRAANRLATATSGTRVLANSDDFRRLWLVNLYSKRPEVGTSPSLAFSTEPEEPAPGPSPTEPGCGTTRECVEVY